MWYSLRRLRHCKKHLKITQAVAAAPLVITNLSGQRRTVMVRVLEKPNLNSWRGPGGIVSDISIWVALIFPFIWGNWLGVVL